MPRVVMTTCDRCGADATTGSRIAAASGDLYVAGWSAELCPSCTRAVKEFVSRKSPTPDDKVLIP